MSSSGPRGPRELKAKPQSSWGKDPSPIADVRALPGIRYYLAQAGEPSTLVAPPYDVIPDAEVARYEALSPHNAVRLTRPGRDYDRASRTFNEWLSEGVLRADPPSMYVHEDRFDGKGRRDLVAALLLAARKLSWPAGRLLVQAHQLQHLANTLANLRLLHLMAPQAEGDVVP